MDRPESCYSGWPLLRGFGPVCRKVTLVNTSTVTIILCYRIILVIHCSLLAQVAKGSKQREPNCCFVTDSCLQLLSVSIFDPEDQSNMHLLLDSSFVSTNISLLSTDSISTNNTSITIEDGAEPTQINQTVRNTEKQVQLEVELTDEARGTAVETRTVATNQVAQTQQMIASTKEADKAEENRAIEEAIQLLYVTAGYGFTTLGYT
jgi:hypothetical protein